MSKITPLDFDNMLRRTTRARNPKAAASQDAAKAEKHQAEMERELSRQFCAWLTMKGVPHIVARTDRKSTVREGWPDVTAMYGMIEFPTDGTATDIARVCCVELKAAGGRLSAAQEACHAHLRAAGVPVAVCWNLESAISFIKDNLRI